MACRRLRQGCASHVERHHEQKRALHCLHHKQVSLLLQPCSKMMPRSCPKAASTNADRASSQSRKQPLAPLAHARWQLASLGLEQAGNGFCISCNLSHVAVMCLLLTLLIKLQQLFALRWPKQLDSKGLRAPPPCAVEQASCTAAFSCSESSTRAPDKRKLS